MNILFQALHACFSEADRPLIRQAYTQPAAPPPGVDQNVLYFHLKPLRGSAPLTEEGFCADGTAAWFQFAAWQLILVFYGPNADSLAWQVYRRIGMDGHAYPRQILRTHHIYPVPRGPGPTLVWEEWGEQHRPRADLTLNLRIAEQGQGTLGTVLSVPPLLIHS